MRAKDKGESRTVDVGRFRKGLGGSPGSAENISFLFRSVLILLLKQFHFTTQIPLHFGPRQEDCGQTEYRLSRY